MANKQINELGELTTAEGDDLLVAYDSDEAGSEKAKKITISNFRWTYTPQTTTNAGSSIEITSSIPSWATEVEILFSAVSLSVAGVPYIQLGDSGGLETSGYNSHTSYIAGSSVSEVDHTDGFYTAVAAAASPAHNVIGNMKLARWDVSENYWMADGQFSVGAGSFQILCVGSKVLSGEMTTINVLASAGSFDSGEIRVRYR